MTISVSKLLTATTTTYHTSILTQKEIWCFHVQGTRLLGFGKLAQDTAKRLLMDMRAGFEEFL
jgi:hypothetical protein